jgi:GST-like protein
VATGIGPYSGQHVHFSRFAPEKLPYAINRYQREAERHYSVLDTRLAQHPYMVGETYTIVDMAVWGWARRLPFVLDNTGIWAEFPHLKRLIDEIEARPAAGAALALAEKHAFKREVDDETRHNLFPQNRPKEA